MTTRIGSQNPKIPIKVSSLCVDALGRVFSYLGAGELLVAESVCHSWARCSASTNQWKKQCQSRLGISPGTDPMDYLPECSSYKKGFWLVFGSILEKRVYEFFIGK